MRKRKYQHRHPEPEPRPKKPPANVPVIDSATMEIPWTMWRDRSLVPSFRRHPKYPDGAPISAELVRPFRVAFFAGMTAGLIAARAPVALGSPREVIDAMIADMLEQARYQRHAAERGENGDLDQVV